MYHIRNNLCEVENDSQNGHSYAIVTIFKTRTQCRVNRKKNVLITTTYNNGNICLEILYQRNLKTAFFLNIGQIGIALV